MMEIVLRAAQFAAKAHGDQKRKYTGEPYIIHPIEVARIVATVGHTPEMLAAALLHDVIEDCGVSVETIEFNFGGKVAELVGALTDISRPSDGNRARRKEIDRLHVAAASADAQTIKLADLISNTSTIVQFDPDFARVYLAEKRILLDVMTRGHPILHARAAALASAKDAA